MSNSEFTSFLSRIYPFENLPRPLLEEFSKQLEIVHFNKDVIIQKEKQEVQNLYFITQGLVQEKSEDEVLAIYSQNEFFDPISLIENYSKCNFATIEDTTCYMMPRDFFIKILHENIELESYFFQSISQKLNTHISNEKNKELVNIMLAKVKDAKVHRAVIVPFNTSIFDAATIIKKEKIPTLLLRDENNEIFVVTDSDFRQKVILNRMDYDESVSKICTGNLIYINENDFLFNAQLIMSKHNLKRLIVKNDENEIVGIIDQISLSAYFSMHTFSVSNEIEEAQSLEELKKASLSLIEIIKSLSSKGVKVGFISKLINQLNRKIIHKILKLTAPKELMDNYCFLVMGSEGRGEQILRTDQDNALIINDNCDISNETMDNYTKKFTEILIDFGFPRCDGNIMVSNPYWCRKTSDFKKLIKSWITNKTGDDFMNLAIFYDALSASGDLKLLKELKEYTFKLSSDSQSFYTNFAKIIMSFNVPLGFFDGFVYDKDKNHKNEIDIKKGAIFILVQSIRSLSLEHKIFRTNTLKRIEELNKLGVLEDELSSELIEAFNFLSTLKLKTNLQKLDSKREIDNFINPNDLNSMDKDLLKDSFKIVNKIKKKLENRYRLNYT